MYDAWLWIEVIFYKKPGEGPSSKSFLFLAKNCIFLIPKYSYLVS